MHTNGKIFGFNIFRRLGDFIINIYFNDISLKQAVNKQEEMEYLVRSLEGCKPRNPGKIKSREEVLENAGILFEGRNLMVYPFKEKSFYYLKRNASTWRMGRRRKERRQKPSDESYTPKETPRDIKVNNLLNKEKIEQETDWKF